MFRPIKNFINYIQNASGNAIFGSATTVAEESEDSLIVAEAVEKTNANNQIIPRSASRVIEHKIAMEQVEVSSKIVDNEVVVEDNSEQPTSVAVAVAVATSTDFEEDIELQIKSSIMLKRPLKRAALNCSLKARDHNQNTAVAVADELDDFRHDPMQQRSLTADGASITSEEYAAEEETPDEFITEEEDIEEPLLDITHASEKFPGSEIIVLNDTDLNSSITSEAPSEDPLAIDDFPQPAVVRETSNPLDTSTNDEASTSGDILWVNIDDIKSHSHPAETNAMTTPPSSKTIAESAKTAEITQNTASSSCDANSTEDHTEELRSDGSDSGLGSETSTLQTTLNSLSDTSHAGSGLSTPTQEKKDNAQLPTNAVVPINAGDAVSLAPLSVAAQRPLRSNLKRRLEIDACALDCADSSLAVSVQKKPKRSINFDNVQVYYFPRQQGFGCVPSAGGCTLGMGSRHIAFKTLTLAEHAAELRRAHRLQLQEINPRGSSSDESEESEEDYLSEGSGSDVDAESSGFLQPVSPKQRRALLKAAGVRKIDTSEKAECRDIRNSREVCGCTCTDFCDPETCACSQAGIKCQVDRARFPCGCSRDACGNSVGRVEFNPTRVRTHFIHTIMRLEMESRQQQNPPLCGNASTSMVYAGMSSTCTVTAASASSSTPHSLPASNYYNLQPQSNYSSGYASPVYNSEQSASFYQTQNAHYGSINATELHTTQQPYAIGNLDAGLYSGAATAAPSYSDMLPAYGSVNTATASATAVYHNMSYSSMQSQVSYASYHHTTATASYLPQQQNTAPPTTYSSCAVPSVPPFGTATTTAASSTQFHGGNLALETTAPSCLTIEGSSDSIVGSVSAGSSFISLNTPVASSSRISQINDLLQHNRNTNATLVAISQENIEIPADSANTNTTACLGNTNSSFPTATIADTSNTSKGANAVPDSVINTPPVNESKSLPVPEMASTKLPQAEPPPLATSDALNGTKSTDTDTNDADAVANVVSTH